MVSSRPLSAALRARWASRPPGVRLAGVIEPATHAVLEQCMSELPARFPGRVVHVNLTAVRSLDLAGAALLVATAGRLRRRGGELRIHLTPELERTGGRMLCA